jgi:glycosyltransferase involved in cell wall biosynthesis
MSEKRKIQLLFLIQTFRTGGSERLTLDLCENLNRERFRCHVIAFVDGELQGAFRQAGAETLCMEKGRHDFFKLARKIYAYVRENGIQVVSAHHLTPYVLGVGGARLNGSKIYYTAHSCNEVDHLNRFWSGLGSFLMRFCEGAIGVSNDVSESIRAKFRVGPPRDLTIINAVNTRRFDLNVNRARKKEELGIRENEKIIGSVGNLRRQKNYPILIRAFKTLDEKMDHLRLVIVGEGARKEDLERLIRELKLEGKVLLTGGRADVPELLKIMDVYCLASLFEGLPLSLLEAMAAGIPVVGTDVKGTRDVIADGKNGLLVPVNDPEKLAEALRTLLTQDARAEEIARNGRREVLERFALDEWVRKYENLFSRGVLT